MFIADDTIVCFRYVQFIEQLLYAASKWTSIFSQIFYPIMTSEAKGAEPGSGEQKYR